MPCVEWLIRRPVLNLSHGPVGDGRMRHAQSPWRASCENEGGFPDYGDASRPWDGVRESLETIRHLNSFPEWPLALENKAIP